MKFLTSLPYLAAACLTLPAFAEPPKAETKDLHEDALVRVYEVYFAPGAEARTIARPVRVVRALSAGTLERTVPGQPPQVEHWKVGEVRVLPADTAGTRNIGAMPLNLYIVALKQAPKVGGNVR